MLDTCGFKGSDQYTRWLRDIQYERELFGENWGKGAMARPLASAQRIDRCKNCPSVSKAQTKLSFRGVEPRSS
ncbi:hypothetical protein B5M10_22035 [Pluralibacter gergoviae]|nr:hypothetical protein B5M10_22035 [Pluralibacter gergoviae]